MHAFVRSSGVAAVLALAACAPTVQQEIQMGNQYAAEIARTMPLIDDAAVASALRRAVQPVRQQSTWPDLDWEFHVVNSDQVNAFAVPGGHIYVFRGLIERTHGYDELAGVLAHEIAHVDERHSAEQMGQANAANVGVGLAYLLLGRQPGTAEQVGLSLAGGAVFAKFSRDDEREADSVAVAYLTRAGIDPGGLPRMFETLREIQQREPGKVEQWFASHPMPSERIENTRRIIRSDPAARRAERTGRTESEAWRDLKRALGRMPPAPKDVKTP